MPDRSEIIAIIDRAILTHHKNLAGAELEKAELATTPAPELDVTIEHSTAEIDRLQAMRLRIVANNRSKVDGEERLDTLSAQLSTLNGQFQSLETTLATHGVLLVSVNKTTQKIEEGCPLFNPDMQEGILEFVREKTRDGPGMD